MASKVGEVTWLVERMEEYRSAQNGIGEIVEDFDDMGKLGSGFVSSDKLEEVDIGDGSMSRPTYIKADLAQGQKGELCKVLTEFADCFAWSYVEMPGFGRDHVEHRLPIKQRFQPFKHPARNCSPEVVIKIKEEVDKLLQAGFIQPCRYTEWVSNVVLVEEKNTDKIWVCINFQKSEPGSSQG
jgi:hypothetical protein